MLFQVSCWIWSSTADVQTFWSTLKELQKRTFNQELCLNIISSLFRSCKKYLHFCVICLKTKHPIGVCWLPYYHPLVPLITEHPSIAQTFCNLTRKMMHFSCCNLPKWHMLVPLCIVSLRQIAHCDTNEGLFVEIVYFRKYRQRRWKGKRRRSVIWRIRVPKSQK